MERWVAGWGGVRLSSVLRVRAQRGWAGEEAECGGRGCGLSILPDSLEVDLSTAGVSDGRRCQGARARARVM